MAQNYTSILAELGTRVFPRVISQINRSNVLAALLVEEPAWDSVCTWDVRLGTETPTTAVIADGADVTVYGDDTIKKASLQFGTYHDAFAVTDKQLAAAGIANNPEALYDYFEAKYLESIERLSRAIANDAINGAGGADQIHGLLASGAPAIGAVGTYAGIDRSLSQNAQFRGNALALSGTPAITSDHLRSGDTLVYNASGFRPDVWLMNPINHNQYGASLGAQRRYIQDVNTADGRTVKLDGGYRTLEFDGAAVIMEKLVPAGTIIGLSTPTMSWSQLPSPPQSASLLAIGGSRALAGSAERQLNGRNLPLTAYLKKLASSSNANRFVNYVYPQLKVKRPNGNVIITGALAT